MLAYAANRPRVGASQSSPNALLFVICGHIVLLAIAMSVRMALPPTIKEPPIIVVPVHPQTPPDPVATALPKTPSTNPLPTPIPRHPEDPLPPQLPPTDPGTGTVGGSDSGTGRIPLPPLPPAPLPPLGVTRGAELLTPPGDLRPPYPQSMLLAEQEATLRLRLTIDESGRVVGVDPVGRADPVFLSAARRHLMAHWRYKPAMKDGHTVPTSIVISLRFELDA